jgi:hypothetical protein
MTVVLLDREHRGQADQCAVVGEDPDDVGAPADLAVEALQRIGNRYERRQMPPVPSDCLGAGGRPGR